jgi:hypothetical protein
MLVAAAIFDHCSVDFFELTRSPSDGKLVFTLLPNRQMTTIHKIPVRMIRLSKKHPHLMVSCGDESDLYLKMWNLSSSKTDPVSQVQTN